MLLLYLHHYWSNTYYAPFMLIPDSTEEKDKYFDDMSCVTWVTGTVGTSFGHAVDEAKIELKTKRSAAALRHLKGYIDAIIHEPSKWEDFGHCNAWNCVSIFFMIPLMLLYIF